MFREEPQKAVVTGGVDVSFRCSVISSPLASHINWAHQERVVREEDTDNYSVSTFTQSENNRGMVTTSTLTIFNVTGFDSSLVECIASYFGDGPSTIAAREVRTTTLGVLGMWGERGEREGLEEATPPGVADPPY